MLIRPGPTRVETYCSNDLLKVPRWRRSKFSTARSCVTPDNACEITPCEIPAACASADIAATKVLKSPPQRAARQGVASVSAIRTMAKRSIKVFLFMNWPGDEILIAWLEAAFESPARHRPR